jgi:signal transduction histidine kinase
VSRLRIPEPAPRHDDVLVAAGLLIWTMPDVPWWWRHEAGTGIFVVKFALSLAMSVPFLWRRRLPFTVLALAVGVLMVRLGLGSDPFSAYGATLVAAYGAGAYDGTARGYARLLGWAGVIVGVGLTPFSFLLDGTRFLGAPFALAGAAFLVGDAASARRGETAAAVEAAHLAERTRIARELHDVLVHQLSAVAVRSGAARLALSDTAGADPRAIEALAVVEQLSREALTELGHLLGALRREPDDAPQSRPTPTLRELDDLLGTARHGGVPVELVVNGPARDLSPGVELTAYRIVQEALTNVTKHAPGATTRVVLDYRAERLGVAVTNGVPALAPAGGVSNGSGRRGIRGMRERATLYGGRLDVGALPDGGFAVTAELPYQAPHTPPAGGERGPE